MRTTSAWLAVLTLGFLLGFDRPLHADEPAGGAPGAAQKAAPVKPLTGRLTNHEGQQVLTLWGTARERGYAQGYLLADEIVNGLENDFERILKPLLPSYEVLLKTMVIPKFQFNERESAELEGLFAGMHAKLPEERLFIKALKRKLELVDIKALNTVGDWYGLGCSSLAVWGKLSAGGDPLVGRNFDFPAFDLLLKHQYVVVRAPDGEARGSVGITYPGCIGTLTGLNSEGVFTAIHDVRIRPTLDKAMRPNVPRLITVRRILEQGRAQGTCKAVHDLVRAWPTLYGNNLMVVGPTQANGAPCAMVLEYDCRLDLEGGCTVRRAGDSTGAAGADPILCLACTNHHRQRKAPENATAPGKRWRYEKLAEVGGAARPETPLTVQDMFAWMGKTAFPRNNAPQGRASAFIGPNAHHGTLHQAVAQTNQRRLHVRLGKVGANITQQKAQTYDVAALLKAALDRQATSRQAAPTTGG